MSQSPQIEAKVKRNSATANTTEGAVKRSIALRLIRHAESQNNQIYYDARRIYKGGTPDFDEMGWNNYVNQRRSSDPGLSDRGKVQAQKLATEYLTTHLWNQASHPITFIVSPMRRTIETIIPTLLELEQRQTQHHQTTQTTGCCCAILIHGFYFESEGCHLCGIPEPGMNRMEISQLLSSSGVTTQPSFIGFDDHDVHRGWYAYGTAREDREESEARAAKFYLWLCEYLDAQLLQACCSSTTAHDIFDAGVSHPDEDLHTHDHDKFSIRERKRRTVILVGHGDFMSLLLKRIVGGFGHAVEAKGMPHRSAFVHANTGVTDLEYFGNGCYLVLDTNHTPHLDVTLKTGGSLKDGWSFLVPDDTHFLEEEVRVAFADELDDHVREQTEALKDLYLNKRQSSSQQQIIGKEGKRTASAIKSMILSHRSSNSFTSSDPSDRLTMEQLYDDGNKDEPTTTPEEMTFVMKRGLKVIGCATLQVHTMTLTDIVVRESCRRSGIGTALVESVKNRLKQAAASDGKNDGDVCIFATPISDESKAFFGSLGFVPTVDNNLEVSTCLPRMKCRL
jgi:broad specificity phosphatase PhoE